MASKRTIVSLLRNTENDKEMGETKGELLELLISCTDLADLDIFSKTDPMCVLFVKQFGQWKELGRTEAVTDQLNPKFTETFILECDRDLCQSLLFSVYDIDCRSMDLRKHDHVGSVEVNLGDLFPDDVMTTTTSRSLRVPGDPSCRGWIHITAELVTEVRSTLHLHLGGTKLDKTGFLSMTKSDSFLELCRSVNSVDFHPVYRTEVVCKSQNPRWRPFDVRVQKLCNGDLDRTILLKCCHLNKDNDVLAIGQAETTLNELITHKGKGYQSLPLTKPKKAKKKKKEKKEKKEKKHKNTGHLKILKLVYDSQSSVLDFVRGGCSLKCSVAIDFTASNGPYDEVTSLHYLDGPMDNQYIEAMKSVVAMISRYDLDQEFLAFGFGAKFSNKRKHKDFFPLSGSSPYVSGLRGLVEAYRSIVPHLTFAGPSRLAPLINEVTKKVASSQQPTQQHQLYHVLVIITDGVVNDVESTVNAVITSADLPLSIVMLGIGPSDFSLMDVFESPRHAPLKSATTGRAATRDNVQFVALRKQKYMTGANAVIAREILASVSRQFLLYMKSKGVIPNRPELHKMAATATGWVDELCDLTDDSSHLDNAVNLPGPHNSASPVSTPVRLHRSHTNTGPTCPTCGSSLDPMSSLIPKDQIYEGSRSGGSLRHSNDFLSRENKQQSSRRMELT